MSNDESERLSDRRDNDLMEKIAREMIQKDLRIMMLERSVSEQHSEINVLKGVIKSLQHNIDLLRSQPSYKSLRD